MWKTLKIIIFGFKTSWKEKGVEYASYHLGHESVIKMKSGRFVIDGREFSGSNVSISNGKVTIDGVVQEGSFTGDINVTVFGDVEVLQNQCGSIDARNVGSAKTGSGDINCGDVSGSVSTGSGDVTCGNVSGNIKTGSGDVYRR